MSTLIYNGIQLSILKTKSYLAESVYDESDTDLLYVKHRLSVLATISAGSVAGGSDTSTLRSAGAAPGPAASAGNTTLVTGWKRLQHMLSLPRRPFVWMHNGEIMLSNIPGASPGMPATSTTINSLSQMADVIDANNGPKPRDVSVTRLTEGSFGVEFTLEYCDDSCIDQGRQPYASIRWQQSQAFDKRWYSTVSSSGTLRVNSSMLTNPDQLRDIITPGAPAGHYRTKARYQISKDGLRLDFEFEDVQRHRLPPGGCGEADGRFTVLTGDDTGATLYGQVDIALSGVAGSNTRDLIELAMGVAMQKLLSAGVVKQRGGYAMQGSVSEELWDNKIALMLRGIIQKAPDNKGAAAYGGFWNGFVTGITGGLVGDAFIPKNAGILVQSDARFNNVLMNRAMFGQELSLYPSGDPISPSTDTGVPVAGVEPGLHGFGAFINLAALAFNDPCLGGWYANFSGGGTSSISSGVGPTGPAQGTSSVSSGASGASGVSGGTSSVTSTSSGTSSSDVPPEIGDLIGAPDGLSMTVSDISTDTEIADFPDTETDDDTAISDPAPGLWEEWLVQTTYVEDANTEMLPSTAPNSNAVPVQFANSEMHCEVAWACTRTGTPPTLPPRDIADDNFVWLRRKRTRQHVAVGIDGSTPKYLVSGCYVYGIIDPDAVVEGYPIPPWLSTDALDNVGQDTDGEVTLSLGGAISEPASIPQQTPNA